MKVKTHLALKMTSCIAFFILFGALVMLNIDNIEASGYPVDLVYFAALHTGWILPTLFFKFVLRPSCPKCRGKGKYVWHFHPKPAEFVCNKCGHIEKTIWTTGRMIN